MKHKSLILKINVYAVTPCVGVWIETVREPCAYKLASVTPCVGVWIETRAWTPFEHAYESHPAWVCGLKP